MQAARVARELVMMERSPPPGASCSQVGDSTCSLAASILGPEGSPYSGGTFHLTVDIPAKYPLEPPKLRFTTPVFHPNIDEGGRICLDILKPAPHGAWRPSLNIASVLTSLQVLLAEPNPDDPLVPEVADMFRYHRSQFDDKARKMTEKHAGQGKAAKAVKEDAEGGEGSEEAGGEKGKVGKEGKRCTEEEKEKRKKLKI